MKKLFALLTALCILCTCLLPAAAEEADDDAYEVITYWNRMYADIDARAGNTDEIIEAVMASGFAAQVRQESGSPVYFGEQRENTDYLVIDVNLPFKENNERIAALLNTFESVTQIYQHSVGCGSKTGSSLFSLAVYFVEADLRLCDADTALQELRDIPHVYAAECITGDFYNTYSVYAVVIEYPFAENRPGVVAAIEALPFAAEGHISHLMSAEMHSISVVEPVQPIEYDRYYAYGDVDRSGGVNADDARKILRFSVELDRPAVWLEQVLADIDCDGDITASDARLALRAAVGLDPLNYYYMKPSYMGLIAGKSVGLAKQGEKLLITASTTGANNVTKCGFTYIRLQRLEKGVWTDVKGFSWENQYANTNAKVFSASVSAPPGYTYRVVCEHYAEAPYARVFTQSATAYNVSLSVTL